MKTTAKTPAKKESVVSDAERHGNAEGKPQLNYNLLGPEIQAQEAAVWAYGAAKYDRAQWLKGTPIPVAADSLLRHIMDLLDGQFVDEESGCTTAGHIITAAKILAVAANRERNNDG